MNYYELQPDPAWKHRYEVDAWHRWSLPGVTCDLCGAAWGNAGTAYPTISLHENPVLDARYRTVRRGRWNVPIAEFLQDDVAMLSPLLPSMQKQMLIGASLGPLEGTVSGMYGDFAWCSCWVLIHPDAYERLRERGVLLPDTVPSALKSRKTTDKFASLLEPSIEYRSNISLAVLPERSRACCIRCGRQGVTRPETLIIDAGSVPIDLDVFRGTDLTTHIFVNERFFEATKSLHLTGLSFQKVMVV